MWIDDAEEGALSNKYVRQNVPDSKKQSRRRIFIRRGIDDAEDSALSRTYKNKQTARNYSLLIFLRF